MKVIDLRNLTDEDLAQKLNQVEENLFKLNFQRRAGRVERPHMFKMLRKDRARIKGILAERKREA